MKKKNNVKEAFRKAYKQVSTNKNYEVIFGGFEGKSPRSAVGKRNNFHDDYGLRWGVFSAWRFVPFTNTCYWWDNYDPEGCDIAENHLRKVHKVKGRIKHRIISRDTSLYARISQMTCHWKDFVKEQGDELRYPTFNQWLKFHYSGD